MHAGPDAELLEAPGGAVGQRLEFRIGDALVHELQRRKGSETLGGRVEHALHGGDVERRVPAPAGRIGLDPGLGIHLMTSRFLARTVSRVGMTRRLLLSWRVR